MQVLSKYKTPVAGNYHESVNGKYIDATPDILKALYSEDKLTDFEDKRDKEVDTNVLETGSRDVPLGPNDVITILTVQVWFTRYHLSLYHFSKYSENVLIPVWFFNFISLKI